MRAPTVLSSLLLVAVALAGCAGDAGEDLEDPDGNGGSGPGGAQIRNGIEGVITDDAFTPLPMAKVEILSLDLSMLTNQHGRYQFANLEPRDYFIVATKEGYRTVTQRAIVEDGKIHVLDFRLDERPSIAPYHTVDPKNGRIACKIVYGTDPESMEHRDCSAGQVDPNNQPVHEFQIQPNPAQVVVEAFWEPGSEAARHLTLTVESVGFGHQDVVFGEISGPTGIRVTLSQTIVERFYPDGGTMRVRMQAGASITGEEAGLDFGAAIQQPFELYVTTFFVDPGPGTYTAKP